MKKKFYAIAAVVMMAASVFTSCGSDEPNPAEAYVGTWAGAMNVSVMNMPFAPDVDYVVSANADGTINVSVPSYTLNVSMPNGTKVGDMTIGNYSIVSIPYNNEKGAYYKTYADGQNGLHFKSENGIVNLDKDYTFNDDKCVSEITVSKDYEGKLTIVNNYSIGAMQSAIKTNFTGSKK